MATSEMSRAPRRLRWEEDVVLGRYLPRLDQVRGPCPSTPAPKPREPALAPPDEEDDSAGVLKDAMRESRAEDGGKVVIPRCESGRNLAEKGQVRTGVLANAVQVVAPA